MTANVDIVGNVTRDPELRYTAGGMAVVSFGVASNRSRRVGDNWEEETSFYDVTCFAGLAENVAESIPRGCRVVIVGKLKQESWETKDGDKRSKIVVIADEVGPSLRWATAEVTKVERGSRDSQRPPAADKRPPAAKSGNRGRAQKATQAPAPSYDYDEEPF